MGYDDRDRRDHDRAYDRDRGRGDYDRGRGYDRGGRDEGTKRVSLLIRNLPLDAR